MPRRGYTLVEVLAVAVLLGLVATLAAPPLARAVAGDPLQDAADRLARGLRDARALAFGRPLVIDLVPGGFTVHARDIAAVRLPEGIAAEWTRGGRPAERLALDPRGHGADTTLVLRRGARELAFAIDGLTGAWTAGAQP